MGEIVEMDGKGRIVIPSQIRQKMGLQKGTQLTIEVKSNELVLSRIETESEERDGDG